MRRRLPGLAVAASVFLAATAPACALVESPRERAVQQATRSVRHELDEARTRMTGLLREGWRSGRASAEETMRALELDFGRRDGTSHSGAIVTLRPGAGGTVDADMVLMSGGQAGGGLDYAGVAAAVCVRLSGGPAADPVVTVVDVACPADVPASNVVVVRAGG
ncbi:hypothetical protein JOL79_07570 [Microbispora sp. RL4-1S]|uniref:Uncharacterized protein n=1 Tax=Microbispora oryzae TaxID=2806554 RepID=A0A940WFC8_9ACTN|nr:hypothetical protein [Microbispora oryzae]MBP2703658.1 hypothetical protein [Microbispora oryzae]